MTEFQEAMRLGQSELGLHLLLNPAKTWSFVGSVPAELAYYRKDGQPITEEDIRGIRQCGAGLFRATIGSRTWPTRELAAEEATRLGFQVV